MRSLSGFLINDSDGVGINSDLTRKWKMIKDEGKRSGQFRLGFNYILNIFKY